MRHGRSPRHTVLLVGEGKTEEAFLNHLKSLYIYRGCGVAVKILNAGGKGAKYIVDYALRRSRRFASDRLLVLLDTDVLIGSSVRKTAEQNNIQLVESHPCLEGLLLRILNKQVPATSNLCKRSCRSYFNDPLTEQGSYKNLTRKFLEQRRKNVPALGQILDSFIFSG